MKIEVWNGKKWVIVEEPKSQVREVQETLEQFGVHTVFINQTFHKGNLEEKVIKALLGE